MDDVRSFADTRLVWHCEASHEMKGDELVVRPRPGSDFWRRTFYSPVLVKDDGCALIAPVSREATMEIAFTLGAVSQFDQAGAVVRVDEETWVKAGLEYVDGQPRLSVVATNGVSDWSTQPWGSTSLRLRIHKVHPPQGAAVVVEASSGAEAAAWQLVRIASLGSEATWGMGVFAAAPLANQEGCTATFHSIEIGEKKPTSHDPDLPADHGGR
ncbi:hypothetical protein CTAYLR_002392 [Chrysophaeum taylorii]|uniref:DUF1349 domain-containing protein n=1 Tax=Chrysophaeum taylorii TaxID=2483200 RepID=A0AAD7UH27_9STRA|nr:hypothetical protein CTAYLR_002392 [Chrysophaeum taylorii]